MIQDQTPNLPQEPQLDISPLYTRVQEVGQIRGMRTLGDFLNPPDEDSALSSEDTLDYFISYHLGHDGAEDQTEDAESDNAEEPVSVPSTKQALDAVRTLLRYKEHCPDTRPEDIRFLQRMERELSVREANGR